MAIFVVTLAFVGGMFAGRWAVKSKISDRMRQHWVASKGWLPLNTQLVRIETSEIELPGVTGWGGGIKAIDDDRIFFASGHGSFGVVSRDGTATVLPFVIDLNLESLLRHNVSQAKNFNINWFRVTDINLSTFREGRAELLVGHHHFNAESHCVELWLSRGVIDINRDSVSLVEPFRKVMSTQPCITFSGPDDPTEAFPGWASGGRILRLGDGKVLFSTGDHSWSGLRGFPALSQDDQSTLGKILIIDLATGHIEKYAKGIRNPQGLMIDSSGLIWETEHGPRGGDELNLIVSGGNYGWPHCTYGTDYGPRPWPLNLRQGSHDCGTPPVFSWTPSIAVSNLIEYQGEEFAIWKNDFLVLSLGGQAVHRLRLVRNHVVYDEPIHFVGHRLRDITRFQDGRLAILTDEAKVILVRNADRSGLSSFLDTREELKRSADMTSAERLRAITGAYAKNNGFAQINVVAKPELRGKKIFQSRCAHCHSPHAGVTTIAPNLSGIVGRRVGSTEYSYSGALLNSGAKWTSTAAVNFAMAPASIYSGSTMPPVPLSIEEQSDLQDYLETLR